MKPPQKAYYTEREQEFNDKSSDLVENKRFCTRAIEAVFFLDLERVDVAEDESDNGADSRLENNYREKLKKHSLREQGGKRRVHVEQEQNERYRRRGEGGEEIEAAVFRAVALPFGVCLSVIDVLEIIRRRIVGGAIGYEVQYKAIKYIYHYQYYYYKLKIHIDSFKLDL